MGTELNGKKVAFLATDGFEQIELTEPWKAVEKAGGEPELVSLETGEIQGFKHHDKADTFPVDKAVKDADPSDYDGLVLPGGVINPDALRMDATGDGVREGVLRAGQAGRAPSATAPGASSRPAWSRAGRSRPGRA